MDNNPYKDILTLFYTKEQSDDFVNELDGLMQSLFSSKEKFVDNVIKIMSFAKKEKLLELLRKNDMDVNEPISLFMFLGDLKQYVQDLLIVDIYLAFEPREQNVRNIVEWFNSNAPKKIILNLIFDKRLMAGAVVEYAGQVKDYSLRKKWEDKIAANNG